MLTLLSSLLLPALCLAKPKHPRVKGEGREYGNGAVLTVNTSLSGSKLSYSVSMNGEKWLQSGAYGFRSNKDWMTLTLNDSFNEAGYDEIGEFFSEVYQWVDSSDSTVSVMTRIKTYPNDRPNVVVFDAEFPQGLSNPTTGNVNDLSSIYPSFVTSDQGDTPVLGWSHFAGFMATGKYPQYGTFKSGSGMDEFQGGMDYSGTVCFFTEDMSGSIVISPLNNFMASMNGYDSNSKSMNFGVMGNASSYPAHWSMGYILVAYNGGINEGMYAWGDEMLRLYNRDRNDAWDRDFTLNWLGYSTDNGAFYYYNTEQGLNYQQTIINIATNARYEGIPYRYGLYDSWWYYQDTSGDSGVTNWTVRPDVFPDGMRYVFEQTNWLVQGHNKYFSRKNVYANNNPETVDKGDYNGPFFPFLWSDHLGLPETEDFWDNLFTITDDWGLVVYEQDWLTQVTNKFPPITYDVTLGQKWLLQMANQADAHDLSIQYCMSYPRHVLTSLQTKSVTQARGSDDYHAGPPIRNNWMIGVSGLFLGAIGLGNSKDNFWTSQIPQYNQHYNADGLSQEPYPRLQSVSATISNGPVQISDQIGFSDISLIMRSCNKEGRLLRSGRNAAGIDRYFVGNAFKNESMPMDPVYWTHARIPGYPYPYAYVLAANISSPFTLLTSDVQLNNEDAQYLMYEANSTFTFTRFTDALGYPVQSNDGWTFEYLSMIPYDPAISQGWYLQGEIDKWISVSPMRFTSIEMYSDGVVVYFVGASQEIVNIGFVNAVSLQQIVVHCEIDNSLSGSAKCFDNECVCSS